MNTNRNTGPDGHLTRTCPALKVNIGAISFHGQEAKSNGMDEV
jgi:hypothetical protein